MRYYMLFDQFHDRLLLFRFYTFGMMNNYNYYAV